MNNFADHWQQGLRNGRRTSLKFKRTKFVTIITMNYRWLDIKHYTCEYEVMRTILIIGHQAEIS